jgi:hypothetical protein
MIEMLILGAGVAKFRSQKERKEESKRCLFTLRLLFVNLILLFCFLKKRKFQKTWDH